ncbi:condensation domain-containing protein, partial [Pseudomonas syringae]|uniref:condensation domain-containing protein n=1 Tax=Pseudomonas syringae TaxID=317 RepID=UPI001F2C90BA
RGYHRRPSLTAERFAVSPFGNGERLYRTGDLARYRADGVIEYAGRIDHQVKLRGLRIELGEIEARLLEHDQVREAVVVVVDNALLAAYVVPVDAVALNISSLKQHVAQALPGHMVPSHIQVLAQMPLSPNGKLDRKALPALDTGVSQLAYVAPQTALARQVADIWQSVLGVAQVGLHDNFFALGGHSLLATQVTSRVRALQGMDVPLKSLFEHGTLEGYVQSLAVLSAPDSTPAITRIERGPALGLSYAQERQWFLWQLEPQSAAYNIPTALRLRGELDLAALQQAFDALIQRHEALRTHFVMQGERTLQVIQAAFSLDIVVEPVAAGIGDAGITALVEDEIAQPFGLLKGPLLRVKLLQVADDDHVLVLTQHHIVSDGASMERVVAELIDAYCAYPDDAMSQAPELALQYVDYAQWQRLWMDSGERERQLGYWVQQLGGEQPVLELPLDHPRPAVQSYRGARLDLPVPAALSAGLQTMARREGTTLYMLLLASFQTLLHRYSGQRDVRVGVPIANRNRVETEGLIGFFVNTQVMRAEVDAQQPFSALLQQVRRAALQAQAYQDLPFEQLVEALAPTRSLSHSPLFQVMFNHQASDVRAAQARSLPGLSIEEVRWDSHTAQFDLTLDTHESADGVHASLTYATDLFEAARIERMAQHWL